MQGPCQRSATLAACSAGELRRRYFREPTGCRYDTPCLNIKTICRDDGHGGKQSGCRVASKLEKSHWLQLAFKLGDQLLQAGFKVLLTRSSNMTVELANRSAAARRNKADLFVNLHFNAANAGRETGKGAEVYTLPAMSVSSANSRGEGRGSWQMDNQFSTKETLRLSHVQRSLVRQLGAEDCRVHRAGFPCGAAPPCRSCASRPASCRVPLRKGRFFIQATLEARRGESLTPLLAKNGLCRDEICSLNLGLASGVWP